jgi:hypothetical protein
MVNIRISTREMEDSIFIRDGETKVFELKQTKYACTLGSLTYANNTGNVIYFKIKYP